jgi:D-arabinose 5-phosphate isomerase GutQ
MNTTPIIQDEQLEQNWQATVDASMVQNALAQAAVDIAGMPSEPLYHLAMMFATCINNGFKVYFTGIGKPGYVAMKAAATCKSIRVQSEYMDAITAGHGDLGSIGRDEKCMIVAISKSGKSTELKTLFQNVNICAPKARCLLLSMTTDPTKVAEIYAGIQHFELITLSSEPAELDGNGIVPSTSNAMFEVAIAIALNVAMHCIGDDKELWTRLKLSHPSGSLQTKVTNLLNSLENEQSN